MVGEIKLSHFPLQSELSKSLKIVKVIIDNCIWESLSII